MAKTLKKCRFLLQQELK